jgi:hypothetical protein
MILIKTLILMKFIIILFAAFSLTIITHQILSDQVMTQRAIDLFIFIPFALLYISYVIGAAFVPIIILYAILN